MRSSSDLQFKQSYLTSFSFQSNASSPQFPPHLPPKVKIRLLVRVVCLYKTVTSNTLSDLSLHYYFKRQNSHCKVKFYIKIFFFPPKLQYNIQYEHRTMMYSTHLTYFHMHYPGVTQISLEKLWYGSRIVWKCRQAIQQKLFARIHPYTHIHAASSAYHPLFLDHIHLHRPFAFDLSLPLPLILYLFSEDVLSITFKYL